MFVVPTPDTPDDGRMEDEILDRKGKEGATKEAFTGMIMRGSTIIIILIVAAASHYLSYTLLDLCYFKALRIKRPPT